MRINSVHSFFAAALCGAALLTGRGVFAAASEFTAETDSDNNGYNGTVKAGGDGYAFTAEDTDFSGNTIGEGSAVVKNYPYTVQGQANAVRNVIETVLLAVPILYLCIALLPLSLMPKIIVTVIVVIMVGGFALTGIRDDSLTRWLKSWWGWRKRRRVMYYRGEVTK